MLTLIAVGSVAEEAPVPIPLDNDVPFTFKVSSPGGAPKSVQLPPQPFLAAGERQQHHGIAQMEARRGTA